MKLNKTTRNEHSKPLAAKQSGSEAIWERSGLGAEGGLEAEGSLEAKRSI